MSQPPADIAIENVILEAAGDEPPDESPASRLPGRHEMTGEAAQRERQDT